jgi:hypothetical protein
MSIGKWSPEWIVLNPVPVILLAVDILFVCQSVQNIESSNTVKAKGCGNPLLII